MELLPRSLTAHPIPARASWEEEIPEDARLCAARHLAVACTQLARHHDLPSERALQFKAAEVRLRAIVGTWGPAGCPALLGPCTRGPSGRSVSLVDLFADACGNSLLALPVRSIDQTLVDEVKELLLGLAWYVPKMPG